MKYKSIKIDGDMLNKVKLADDVVLEAKNQNELKEMALKFIVKNKDASLELYIVKIKISSNSNDIDC